MMLGLLHHDLETVETIRERAKVDVVVVTIWGVRGGVTQHYVRERACHVGLFIHSVPDNLQAWVPHPGRPASVPPFLPVVFCPWL